MSEVRLDLFLDASEVMAQIEAIEANLRRLADIQLRLGGLDEALYKARQLSAELSKLSQINLSISNLTYAAQIIDKLKRDLPQLSRLIEAPSTKEVQLTANMTSFQQQIDAIRKALKAQMLVEPVIPAPKRLQDIAPQIPTNYLLRARAVLSDIAKRFSEGVAEIQPPAPPKRSIDVYAWIQSGIPQLTRSVYETMREIKPKEWSEALAFTTGPLSVTAVSGAPKYLATNLERFKNAVDSLYKTVGRDLTYTSHMLYSSSIQEQLKRLREVVKVSDISVNLNQGDLKKLSEINIPTSKIVAAFRYLNNTLRDSVIRIADSLNVSVQQAQLSDISDPIRAAVSSIKSAFDNIKNASDMYARLAGGAKLPPGPPTITAFRYFDYDRERFKRAVTDLRATIGTDVSFRTIAALYMLNNAIGALSNRLSSIFEEGVNRYVEAAASLQKIRIVTGAEPAVYRSMVKRLMQLSGEVMMPFNILAEIGYAFATRGYAQPERISDVLRPLAIASLVTGETLDTMARSILSLMQAWNPMQLSSLREVAPYLVKMYSDIMTYAYAKSPLEVRWFKDIANYVAPLFAHFGYSIEETLAVFMGMAQTLPTPGIGARSMRMLLFNLLNPERGFRVMEQFGINPTQIFTSFARAGKTLVDAFRELFNQIRNLPTEMRAALFRQLGGGVRGGMAAAMLMNEEVLKNMMQYITQLQWKSLGFTTIAQLQYRATPIGAYQAAEARLSALLTQLGENIISVRTALTNLKASLVEFANRVSPSLAGGLYGAMLGGKFAAQWILPTVTNVAILSYLSRISGGTGGLLGWISANTSTLIGVGIIGSLVAMAGTGVAMALQTAMQRSQQRQMQQYLAAFSDRGYIEMAAYTIAMAFKRGSSYYVPSIGATRPLLGLFEGTNIYKLTREQFQSIAKGLSDSGMLLKYAVMKTVGEMAASTDTAMQSAADILRSRAQPLILRYIQAFSDLPNINFKSYEDVRGMLATYFGLSGKGLELATREVVEAYSKISSRLPKEVATQLAGSYLISLIGAAALGKVTGYGERLFATLNRTLKTDITLEEIRNIVEAIANYLKTSTFGAPEATSGLRQEPSYAQLLDLWLGGILSDKALATTLPALKEGDWTLVRTWTPYNYRQSVVVWPQVMTNSELETLRTVSAYLDMASSSGTIMPP